MSILQIPFTVPQISPHHLSFSSSLSSSSPESSHLFLHSKLARLTLHHTQPPQTTPIRMGGGPRTYPGGVSKWEWKRMHQNRSKKLLKARLARERQIYLMRKKAELKSAVSELERPDIFSVRAKEQVKMLAERFQRPEGFDMWTDQDGPERIRGEEEALGARVLEKPYSRVGGSGDLDRKKCRFGDGYNGDVDAKVSGRQLREKGVSFGVKSDSSGSRNVVETKGGNGQIGKPCKGKLRNKEVLGQDRQVGLNNSKGLNSGRVPSTRVFHKGTVHGVNPYSRVDGSEALDRKRWKLGDGFNGNGDAKVSGRQLREKGVYFEIKSNSSGSRNVVEPKGRNGKLGQVGSNNSKGLNSGQGGFDRKQRWKSGEQKLGGLESEAHDMSLQGDGSYGLGARRR